MKEFKFACPVCGQHITAASGTTGAQIECPTCFQKIVVPQERTDDTKLIINAAIADRPRAPQTLTAAPVPAPRQGRGLGGVLALFLVLLLVAVAGYVARERLFRPRPKSVQTITNAPSAVVPAVVKAGADWTMDPTRVKIPREPAGGSVHGAGFSLTRATLQGGLLSLRQGKGWPPELAVAIQFPAKRGEDLAEKHVVVLPEQAPPVPRVTMRWKNEQGKSVTKGFASNYLLRLEFGRAKEGKMSGEIYLALPDENQSYVAGTFMAEIRAPVAPKKGKR